MEESVILKEEIDPNYEPNSEEIREYAVYLGLELPEDQDLLYIAREGLKASLPEDWKPCITKQTGEIYYFNFVTGSSDWEHPCDKFYKSKVREMKAAKSRQSKELLSKAQKIYPKNLKILQGIDRKEKQTSVQTQITFQKRKLQLEHLDREKLEQDLFEKKIKNLQEQLAKQKQKLIQQAKRKIQGNSKKQLDFQKEKLISTLGLQKEEAVQRETIRLKSNLQQSKTQLEYLKQKLKWQVQQYKELEKRFLHKLEFQNQDFNSRLSLQKKKLQQKFSLKTQSEIPKLAQSDSKYLISLESDLQTNLLDQLQKYRQTHQKTLLQTRQTRQSKIQQANSSLQNRILSKISEQKQNFNHKLSSELAEYTNKKQNQLSTLLKQHQNKILNKLEAEKYSFQRRSLLDFHDHTQQQLTGRILHLTRQLQSLQSELLSKQKILSNFLHPKQHLQQQDRLSFLQNHIKDLKIKLQRPPSQKQELRDTQRRLQIDRELWRAQILKYKANPTQQKRVQLLAVKKAIQRQIKAHNDQVKRYKHQTPSELSELEEARQVLPRHTQYSKQPWKAYNQHIYQRQINKFQKHRNSIKQVVSRHGT